jgi:Zn-dependent metalloprotease
LSACFHPLNCIMPPHILREIAERGSPAQREMAVKTLRTTSQFRVARQSLAALPKAFETLRADGKQRRVYDAEFGSDLPGLLVRTEGAPPSGDPAIDEAYDGTGATYDMYFNIFNRRSIDNRDMHIISTVHYQQSYDNAFWNGRQIVFGDGDEDLPPPQRLFNRFTIALDIIGHELTHGVINYSANLVYQGQPGALNEHFSDVFGILVKHYHLRQTAPEADWIIGRGIFTENIRGEGLRSMKAPGRAYDDPLIGRDPQPAHMRNYVETTYDNGGVHINSGIPNHAFYVAARELGGFAWEKAGRIWYDALLNRLHTRATFQEAALHTQAAAQALYGTGSLEFQAVRKGWTEVGVIAEESTAEGCLPALTQVMRSFQRL